MSNVRVHTQRYDCENRSAQARPLALLHGWGLNCRVFDALAADLVAKRDLLAADLPGHGLSTLADWDEYCAALLASLPPRFDLLGWSLGGQVALELARLAPQRVARLVLVATTPRFVREPRWEHGMPPELLSRFAAQLSNDYRRTVADFLELQVRGSKGAEATLHSLQHALRTHGEAGPEALRVGLDWLESNDLREPCRALAQPALAIAGQYDRVTPPAAIRELARALPQGQAIEIRRAGHAPFLSHRRECVAAIEDWFDSVAVS